MKKFSRRDFLRFTGGATLSSFMLPDLLFANDGTALNDFKVLVMFNMRGGNDALNMYLPTDPRSGITTGWETYVKSRAKALRVEENNLMSHLRAKVDSNGYLAFSSASEHPYFSNGDIKKSYLKGFYKLDKNGFDGKTAINSALPEVAHWMDKGRGAIIQNIGSIIQPSTKSELRNDKSICPPFLFSHDQQDILMQTGQAKSINMPTGWLGRLSDEWSAMYSNTAYKININLSPYGRSKVFFGNETTAMSFSPRGPMNFNDKISQARKDISNMNNGDMFRKYYNEINARMISQVEETVDDWKSVSGTNDMFAGLKDAYGLEYYKNEKINLPTKEMYGFDEDGTMREVESFVTAAKLIKIGKAKGFKRMIINIPLAAYDTHSTQPIIHPKRMRGLGLGIDRFMRVIDKEGLSKNVTLFSTSEFGRSIGSNSDGTDHAWGAAHMVLGGAVKAGNYGEFPDLTLGGDQDYTKKGRLIPTVSFTQYYATILKWFGADEGTIDKVLPELKNFSVKDLGFMETT